MAWSTDGAWWRLSGGLFYLLGTIGVTMVCHVPRNNALARLDPAGLGTAEVRERYVAEWTRWNHLRTAAALAAAASFTLWRL